VFLCVESLYSMQGDLCPLEEVCHLATKYNARVIVDEAHATGILGPRGEGLVAGLQNQDSIIARIHTFGKALGCHGAAVMGSALLRNFLINHCRTFIYTTAFPLHTLVAIDRIYKKLPQLEQQRKHLQQLIRYFNLQIDASPLPIRATTTAIQSIPVKGNSEVLNLSAYLRSQGLDVRPIRSPTVRPGHECLRVCLHAFNATSHIDTLISALAQKQQALCIA